MFITRLISGITVLLIAIGIIVFGTVPLWFASIVISGIAMYELYKAFGINESKITYVSYVLSIIFYFLVLFHVDEYIGIFITVTLLTILSIYVFTFPKYHINDVIKVLFTLIYIPIMFSFLYKIRALRHGDYLIWLVFISSWGSDVCAYAVGMLIGKHKIAPKLSPKKSVEGCLGGILGAAIMGYIFGYVFKMYVEPIRYIETICTVACTLASVLSQIGDFAASGIKRNQQIKDYGNLIPGHGGILDRVDSILLTAPVVFFVIMFLSRI
jgi:cytidylyltransferase family